jgi:hypothetical protein
MTEQEIDQLEAGQQLDALIAAEIFSLPQLELKNAKCPYCESEMRFCGSRSWCGGCNEWRYSPYLEYSDDIAVAWQVVEVFRRGWNNHTAACVSLNVFDYIEPQDCQCVIYAPDIKETCALGREMPVAICRAALKVKLSSG